MARKQKLIEGILLHLAQQAPDDKTSLSELRQALGNPLKDDVLQTLHYLKDRDCIEFTGISRDHILCWITYTGRQFVRELTRENTKPESTKTPETIDAVEEQKLPFTLRKKIVAFLLSLPNIYDKNTQRSLLLKAGLDTRLDQQISFIEPAAQFVQGLVSTLTKYGKLEDGRNALEAVLESAKNYVGQDRREYCDKIIRELHDVLDSTT